MRLRERACVWVMATCASGFLPASSEAVPNDIAAMNAWATEVTELIRGPMDIRDPELGYAAYGVEADVVGPASPGELAVVSLGDGGSITLFFDDHMHDGPGADFAVFENGFFSEFGLFAEFAFVQVSSNGVDFAEFDTVTTRTSEVWPFEEVDPADYAGFAGDEEVGLGSLFDLSDLVFHPSVISGDVDLSDIAYVRLIDVVGNGKTFDSLGNQVWDPFPTIFDTGGFDLNGIGVINVPEPGVALSLLLGWLALLFLDRRHTRAALRLVLPALIMGIGFTGAAAQAATIVTFESFDLTPSGVYNGSDSAGGFSEAGVDFVNDYNTSWLSWDGFAASSISDGTTAGFSNQYASKPGSGAEGSDQYAIGYQNYFDDRAPTLFLPEEGIVLAADFTNTTYAYFSMLDGDQFSTQFGGDDGTVSDWFTLTVFGLDASGLHTGSSLAFDLADYRGGAATGTILDSWLEVDLSSLGLVHGLEFSMTSSTGVGTGITNPTYFAIDNLVFTPEPGTGALLGFGLIGLAARSSRNRSR